MKPKENLKIMGKLTAVLGGTFAALVISYYFLSGAFSPLINWLAPTLGYRFIIILGLVYLLFGNPLQSAGLFVTWVVLGIIVGLGARRLGRGISSALLVYGITFAIFVISLISFIPFLSHNYSGLTTTVNNIPPGTNIATILSEPVISNSYNILQSFLRTGTAGGKGGNPFALIGSFLEGAILSFVIFLVVSAIVGFFASKGFKIKRKQMKASDAEETPKETKMENTDEENSTKYLVLFVVAVLAFSGIYIAAENGSSFSQALGANNLQVTASSFPISLNDQMSAHNNALSLVMPSFSATRTGNDHLLDSYSIVGKGMSPSTVPTINGAVGAALSLVSGEGNVTNIYGMVSANNQAGGLLSGYEGTGNIFSVLFLQENIGGISLPLGLNSGNITNGISTSNLLSLVPGYLYVTAYEGTYASSSAKALSESTRIANSLGVPGLNQLIYFQINSNSSKIITYYVFSAEPAFSSTAKKIGSVTGSFFQSNGIMPLFVNSVTNPYINMSGTKETPSTSILAIGQVNVNNLKELLPANITSAAFTSNITASFAVSAQFWDYAIHSEYDGRAILFSSLFNYNTEVTMTSGPDFALVSGGTSTSSSPTFSLSSYKFNTVTDNYSALKSSGYNLSGNITNVTTGTQISLSDYSVLGGRNYTPDLDLLTNVKEIGYRKYLIDFTVSDISNTGISSTSVNLNSFLNNYKVSAATIVPINPSNFSIGPGQTIHFEVKLLLLNPGAYVFRNVLLTYDYNGTYITESFNQFVIYAPAPSVSYAVTSTLSQSFSLIGLGLLGSPIVGPLNPLEILFLLLVLLDAFLEYRNFSKRKKEKRE